MLAARSPLEYTQPPGISNAIYQRDIQNVGDEVEVVFKVQTTLVFFVGGPWRRRFYGFLDGGRGFRVFDQRLDGAHFGLLFFYSL
jgi:hypothetical protein